MNGDFNAPDRKDYSIEPTSAAYEFTPGDGVRGNIHQQTREAYRIPSLSDRAAVVKIVNRTGRLRLFSCVLQTTVRATGEGSFTA